MPLPDAPFPPSPRRPARPATRGASPARCGAPLVAALLGALLAGCNAAPRDAPVVPAVARADARPPEGAGCSGEIARFRAVVANDLETGNVARAVHDRVAGEVDAAAALCASGADAGARARLAATKARHGYP